MKLTISIDLDDIKAEATPEPEEYPAPECARCNSAIMLDTDAYCADCASRVEEDREEYATSAADLDRRNHELHQELQRLVRQQSQPSQNETDWRESYTEVSTKANEQHNTIISLRQQIEELTRQANESNRIYREALDEARLDIREASRRERVALDMQDAWAVRAADGGADALAR